MKIKFLFFTLCFFILGNVKANEVSSIKMDIYIDDYGTAHITETWNAKLTSGTEGYKPYYNLGNSIFENYSVKMDEKSYTYSSNWDTKATLKEKAYKNGINKISNGIELCFGISSYGRHTYVLEYDITNFVTRTTDADMVYWTLMPYDFSVEPGSVYIKIRSDFEYNNSIDAWGYGNYGGTIHVNDEYIEMKTDGKLEKDEYMTILVKFPKNSFTKLDNNVSNDFNYYYDMAEKGAVTYNSFNFNSIYYIIISLLFWVGFIFTIIKSAKMNSKSGSRVLDFGTQGNKISKNNNLFRELPCDKDIYRAYWIAKNYRLIKKQTDFLGAILLKWLKQNKITIKNDEVGLIFKKDKTTIVLYSDMVNFDTNLEMKLYEYMYKASKDGILESKEFEKWCRINYSEILKWFDDILDYENDILIKEGKLIEKEKKYFKIFKGKVLQVDPSMYVEATKMQGLKQFFMEFKNMKDKSAIEVHLWEEYLMYAQIFGVAKKVAEEFKKIYPDVITDYSYNSVIFINSISDAGMASASVSKNRSSGGGGGGSFGGGGGGGGFR